MVRKLHRVHNDTLLTREKEYRSRLGDSKVEGDIELFT
jgi:chemotaxis protein CheD